MTEAGKPGTVLLVEDEPAEREVIAAVLSDAGHVVATAATGKEAIAQVESHPTDVVVLDLGLPDIEGLELLRRLTEMDGDASVIVLTGRDDIQTVVEAMKRGAENFLVKPIDIATLCATVDKALRRHRLVRRAAAYEGLVAARRGADEIGAHELVGSSRAMAKVRELVGQVAPTESSVVLSGETGTGKGAVAHLLHNCSRRPHGSFVQLSCAALPGTLVESEIFGHERGAFTDAKNAKPGLLEVADGGTFFLDEIAELAPPAQSKLLKVIEDRTFRRLGGVRDVRVDVRFVVATHRDLAELVRKGSFRQDLYYRLNVFQIVIAPLRERGDDVLELAYRFVGELNPVLGRSVERIAAPAAELLLRYSWPGNVRKLHNVIERAMILAMADEITVAHLPKDLRDEARAGDTGHVESLEEVEAAHIEHVLRLTRGNVKLAAHRLGISRSTLYAKMGKYKFASTSTARDDARARHSDTDSSRGDKSQS
jgi:DNA-binding NtrC family response regulator